MAVPQGLNALKTRDRYLELLEQGKTVAEILLVEKELERLNATLELLKAEVNTIDKDVAYSTLSVNLTERNKLGPLGYVAKGLYSGVRWLFVRG